MNEFIKKYGVGVIAGIVILAVGVAIGFSVARKGSVTTTGTDTYQAGWDAAKKRLAESESVIAIPAEVITVGGLVNEINGNKLTVKIRPIEPLADPDLDIRIVTVDATTKLFRTVQRDPVVYQKEMQEYNRKLQQSMGKPPIGAPSTIIPPQMFEHGEIKITDIKPGDQITVNAAQNIKEAKEFTAVTISVQPAIITSPPAPAVL